ncbi:MAG: TetR/AcrR family transcriptional regulator [Nannocystales bacterium]
MEPSTRERIVEAADDLFYRQGYEHTSFASIASAVQISRGNFYHHFKSKDQILDAVIDLRLENTQGMLDEWEQEASSPRDRIRCFVRILVTNRAKIELYGCPVGTLCTELAKLEHAAQDKAARVFTLFRGWLTRQFEALGHGAASDNLALHVLGHSQGVAVLASTFREPDYIDREVEEVERWLRRLRKPRSDA